jgi:hypothetical protein
LELKSVNENSSKENIFFRYIKKGIVNSDDEAANILYGAEGDDDRYRMLKSRLKQKLLNHLLFLDFSDNNQSTPWQYEQECIQFLHQAKMLDFVGERKITKNLLQKALTLAERCEFTQHQLTSLEELAKVYSLNCQPHLFESTIKDLAERRKVFKKEEEARTLYLFMEMMVVKSVNSRKKNLDKVEDAIENLKSIWLKTRSQNVFEYFSKLKILFLRLTGQFEDLIPFLHEIESGEIEGKKLNPNRQDQKFISLSIAHAYLKGKKLKKGIEYIDSILEYYDRSRKEWLQLIETYFLIAIHDRNYKLALELINQVFDNKNFDKSDAKEKEKWRLYNVYLHFGFSGNFFMKNFNFSDFIDEMPEYDKDEEGIQVAIIILQFLYYLEQGDIESLKIRRNALKKYMSNHFKENFSYRTRTFYKLLNIVVENSLDPKKIQNKSRYLLNKLPANQIVNDAYIEMEIIPYEHLWDFMMNTLRYNQARQPTI